MEDGNGLNIFFFFKYSGTPRNLPSSPTRPFSDLLRHGPRRRAARLDVREHVLLADPPPQAGAGHAPEFLERDVVLLGQAQHQRREAPAPAGVRARSEEHTSELQSQSNLVCRLLLE